MNRALALLLLSSFVLTATFGGSCQKRKRDPETNPTSDPESNPTSDPEINPTSDPETTNPTSNPERAISPETKPETERFPNLKSELERERVYSPEVMVATRKAQLMQLTYKRRTPDSGPNKDTEQDCKPEDWTVDDISTKDHQEQAKGVRVYYPNGESLENVKKLTHDREPVNIEMDRQFYDKDQLRRVFHYEEGAYKDSTPDVLMPNIAIFTPARIKSNGRVIPNLNVINLIGAGFDHEDQPDHQYYLTKVESDTVFKEGKEEEFVGRMKMMYRFAFHHAKENGLDYIQHFGVGEGAFAGKVKNTVIEIRKKVIDELKEEYKDIKIVCDIPFYVPQHLFERHSAWEESMTNDNTLFINAWDPWSMIGNGNKADASLDGFWGSVSNMAYLGWPETNFNLKNDEAYIAV